MLTAANFNVRAPDARSIQKLNNALAYLQHSPTATSLLQSISKNGTGTQIIIDYSSQNAWGNRHQIRWNPDADHGVYDSRTGRSGLQSAAITLAHEGAHAIDANLQGNLRRGNRQYDNEAERYAANYENQIARELGEPTRDNHRYEFTNRKNDRPRIIGAETLNSYLAGDPDAHLTPMNNIGTPPRGKLQNAVHHPNDIGMPTQGKLQNGVHPHHNNMGTQACGNRQYVNTCAVNNPNNICGQATNRASGSMV